MLSSESGCSLEICTGERESDISVSSCLFLWLSHLLLRRVYTTHTAQYNITNSRDGNIHVYPTLHLLQQDLETWMKPDKDITTCTYLHSHQRNVEFIGFILFCSYFHKKGLGEADDSDAEIKALKRDTRLEALFVDIPKV